MNAFFYPSKRGINFAKIRGFKVTDYSMKLVGRRACRSGGDDRCKHWFYVSVHTLNLIIHLLQVRQVPNVL